jgi:hypothetical protein
MAKAPKTVVIPAAIDLDKLATGLGTVLRDVDAFEDKKENGELDRMDTLAGCVGQGGCPKLTPDQWKAVMEAVLPRLSKADAARLADGDKRVQEVARLAVRAGRDKLNAAIAEATLYRAELEELGLDAPRKTPAAKEILREMLKDGWTTSVKQKHIEKKQAAATTKATAAANKTQEEATAASDPIGASLEAFAKQVAIWQQDGKFGPRPLSAPAADLVASLKAMRDAWAANKVSANASAPEATPEPVAEVKPEPTPAPVVETKPAPTGKPTFPTPEEVKAEAEAAKPVKRGRKAKAKAEPEVKVEPVVTVTTTPEPVAEPAMAPAVASVLRGLLASGAKAQGLSDADANAAADQLVGLITVR